MGNNRFNAEAVKSAMDGFGRNLGNGVLVLQHAAFLFEMCAESGDTNYISRMIQTAKDKHDNPAASGVLFLAKQVWPGLKVETDAKTKHSRLKIKGCKLDANALATIVRLAGEKKSFRSKDVKAAFNSDTVAKTNAEKAQAFVSKASAEKIAEKLAEYREMIDLITANAKNAGKLTVLSGPVATPDQI